MPFNPEDQEEQFEPFHMRLFQKIFDFPSEPLTQREMNAWKSKLMALHAFAEHTLATDNYRERYRQISDRLNGILDLSIDDPEEFLDEEFNIFSAWVAAFASLYAEKGLTVKYVSKKAQTQGVDYERKG